MKEIHFSLHTQSLSACTERAALSQVETPLGCSYPFFDRPYLLSNHHRVSYLLHPLSLTLPRSDSLPSPLIDIAYPTRQLPTIFLRSIPPPPPIIEPPLGLAYSQHPQITKSFLSQFPLPLRPLAFIQITLSIIVPRLSSTPLLPFRSD